jgi:hypothetical protein
MNDTPKIRPHVPIAVHLFLLAAAIAVGAGVAYYNQEKVATQLHEQIDAQIQVLWDLALVTDRNGADEVISTIVADCPRRAEYETLLNQLGSLSKKELITVQNLYESCGNFYAERKALMVAKLERELAVTLQLRALLGTVRESETNEYKLEAWKELVVLEQARSVLLTEQNSIQSKIIGLLITGATSGSKEVRSLVSEAQSIAELLNVRDHEIDRVRGELQS